MLITYTRILMILSSYLADQNMEAMKKLLHILLIGFSMIQRFKTNYLPQRTPL